MALYLLDSDVLIAYLRKRQEAVASLKGLEGADHDLAISALSVVEVLAGALPKEVDGTRSLLDSLSLFSVEREIAHKAADLMREERRKGHTLSLPDAVIAATALHHRATLLTYNVRHFPMPGLRVQSPGQLR